MSGKMFSSQNDGDEGTEFRMANESETINMEFTVEEDTSLSQSISTEFDLDDRPNPNQTRKRSLSPLEPPLCKKSCTEGKEVEIKYEYSDDIFESDTSLQIDCSANPTQAYRQDDLYVEGASVHGTDFYASATTFDSTDDVNLKMTNLQDANIPNAFPQGNIDSEKLHLCESLRLEPKHKDLYELKNIQPENASSSSPAKEPQNFSCAEMNEGEINAMIDGLNDEINNVLEETAERNKLTATNVKNILRHVITNEYVLAMVRNTMKLNGDEEGELEEAIYEPKLTRSKAKELREKQATLPWPVSSPAKQNTQKITKKLLEEEFSEDDNSSDEEYRPNEDECHSEEEEATSPKENNVGSPSSDKSLGSSPGKIENCELSPLVIVESEVPPGSNEADLIALRTRSKLPLVDTPLETIEASFIAPDITVDMYDTECDDEDWQNFLLEFTKPLDTKISLEQPDDDGEDDPEYTVFEEEEEDIHEDDDKISAKISQKELNSLMDAILETAEQELIEIEEEEEDEVNKEKMVFQPQISVQSDKILEQCAADDTSDWFSEHERIQLEEQMRMEESEEDTDPDMSFLYTTKPSRKSKKAKKRNRNFRGKRTANDSKKRKLKHMEDEEVYSMLKQKYEAKKDYTIYGEHVANELRKLSQKVQTLVKHFMNTLLFDAAMGKFDNHVQLLTQSFILSHGIREMTEMQSSSALILEELGRFCMPDGIVREHSYFHADNLDESLTIVNAYKAQKYVPISTSPKTADKKRGMPEHAKSTIAHSKAFIYPHLLPVVGFCPRSPIKSKAAFTDAEDMLLALGLEQFSVLEKPIQWVQTLLLPTKTVQQLKLRIKNCKMSKCSTKNPIKYYHLYKEAPPISRCVRSYDPTTVKPACELSSDVLPKWMHPYVVNKLPVLAPAPMPPPPPPKIAIVHPLSCRMLERRKYQHIFPHVSYVSPFKKLSPILRKYTHHRRIAPVPPLASTSPRLTGINYKSSLTRPIRPKLPPLKPKPPPITEASFIPVTIAPCFLPTENLSIDVTPILVPPVTTAVVINPEPIYVSGAPQVIQNPELSILPTVNLPPFMEIGPMVCGNSSQEDVEQEKVEEGKVENAEERMETIDENKTNNNDIVVNTLATNNETETFNNGSISGSVNETSETVEMTNVSSISDNSVHDQEITPDSEACEEADDEAVDDEQDLAALMAASSTICKRQHSSIKKKNKHQRDLESTLQLLSPNIMASDPKKEERETIFAQTYLIRAMEALKDEPQTCERFLKTLCSYEYCTKSPIKLFGELSEILKDHPVLIEEFVGFLSPEQAKECGKFLQYTTISKIRVFLRKMEIHFSNQPHHIQRILRILGQLQNQEELTSTAVITALQPLLRNQSHLLEEFLQLLPDEPPPEWYANPEDMLITDFEEVTIPNNSDGEYSSSDSFEEMKIPEAKDPYGGKDCPCSCHSSTVDVRVQNRNRHCVQCGTKFIDGRIYIQTGKVLKPAQVVYHNASQHLSTNHTVSSKAETLKSNAENCCVERAPQHSSVCQDTLMSEHPEIQNTIGGTVTPAGITVTPTEQTLNTVAENLTPTASMYPCDVIEDAVLPPVTNSGLSSIPSDFSRLQESFSLPTKHSSAIDLEMQKDPSKHVRWNKSENINSGVKSVAPKSDSSSASSSRSQCESLPSSSVSSSSVSQASPSRTVEMWTREEDKVILETCQKHGIRNEAFIIAADMIRRRTVTQIKHRFVELIRQLEKQLKAAKS